MGDNQHAACEQRFGVLAASATAIIIAIYAATLAIGLARAPAGAPIDDPWFALLELEILAPAPALVAFMVALRQWAHPRHAALGLMAVIFMAMAMLLTSAVRIVILCVSRSDAFAADAALLRQLAFEWPSVVYAADILAWDVFFALGALCAAPLFRDHGGERWIGRLFYLSGALALSGLAGAVMGDMAWRNIGIVGYAGIFPVAAALSALLFVNGVAVH
jgi:hypothetical protein